MAIFSLLNQPGEILLGKKHQGIGKFKNRYIILGIINQNSIFSLDYLINESENIIHLYSPC